MIPQHSKIALSECSKREEGFKTSEMDARIMLTTHNRTLSTTTHEIVSPKWQIQCALSMAAASDSQFIRVVLYTMVVF